MTLSKRLQAVVDVRQGRPASAMCQGQQILIVEDHIRYTWLCLKGMHKDVIFLLGRAQDDCPGVQQMLRADTLFRYRRRKTGRLVCGSEAASFWYPVRRNEVSFDHE